MIRLISWLWAPITNPGMALAFRLFVLTLFTDVAWIGVKVFVIGH